MTSWAERHARACGLLPHVARTALHGWAVAPCWNDAGWFHYVATTPSGREYVAVDPVRRQRVPLFDHHALASALSAVTGEQLDPDALPLEDVEVLEDGKVVAAGVNGQRWRWSRDQLDPELVPGPREPAAGELLSPDGSRVVFLRDGDLWLRTREDGEERRLTEGAGEGVAWATPTDTGGPSVLTPQQVQAPLGVWSPDSRWLVTHRLDQRAVPLLHLTQARPGGQLPLHHQVRYPVPGSVVASAEFFVIDAHEGTATSMGLPIDVPYMSPLQAERVWWSPDSTLLWLLVEERGGKSLRLLRWDGHGLETVVEERRSTNVLATPIIGAAPLVRTLDDGDVLWWSERDGFGHLYRYGARGECVQVTRGAFQVREVVHVDQDAGALWFLAGGEAGGRCPYDNALYRVGLDGEGLGLLTDDDADHALSASPDGRWFVDTVTRPGGPPTTVLRNRDGDEVLALETGDPAALLAAGFRWPERFRVMAADGVTPLWGLLYLPSDFDPDGSYPVVDSMYPGPQIARQVRVAHPDVLVDPFTLDALGSAPALASLGFAVMALDGRGTPLRSRAFRERSWGRIGDVGLDDHVAALHQLAVTRPWMDTSRVGAIGHSGGGYAAARSLMLRPDVYSVAVASAGNHDQRGYFAVWGDTYHGLLDEVDYDEQANASLVESLRGRLLLVHGECDDNVHPGLLLGFVDRLIEADKDFDLLLVPGVGHDFGARLPYVTRRGWEFLVRHLHGIEPVTSRD